jgi:hypothetical protein
MRNAYRIWSLHIMGRDPGTERHGQVVNISVPYFADLGVDCQLGGQESWLTFFLMFSQFLQINSGIVACPKIRDYLFLPHPFQFMIHSERTFRCVTEHCSSCTETNMLSRAAWGSEYLSVSSLAYYHHAREPYDTLMSSLCPICQNVLP